METLLYQIILQAVLLLYPAWRIYSKAGLNPAISLTALIPGLGILLTALILAFSNWQVQPAGSN
jgi:hypothetical protein